MFGFTKYVQDIVGDEGETFYVFDSVECKILTLLLKNDLSIGPSPTTGNRVDDIAAAMHASNVKYE